MIGPLGVFYFIRHPLQPGGQENLFVLEILSSRFGANLTPPFVGEELHSVVEEFLFELAVAIHPGHGAGVPEGGHPLEGLGPGDNRP